MQSMPGPGTDAVQDTSLDTAAPRSLTIVGAGLSVMVPVVIKRHVYSFVDKLLHQAGMNFEADKERVMFAIHPGGPKIVEHIQDELGLLDHQVAISKSVFHENGNMSSATIPHILKGIIEEPSIRRGTRVVCLGFGPGLTVTGLVLEKI